MLLPCAGSRGGWKAPRSCECGSCAWNGCAGIWPIPALNRVRFSLCQQCTVQLGPYAAAWKLCRSSAMQALRRCGLLCSYSRCSMQVSVHLTTTLETAQLISTCARQQGPSKEGLAWHGLEHVMPWEQRDLWQHRPGSLAALQGHWTAGLGPDRACHAGGHCSACSLHVCSQLLQRRYLHMHSSRLCAQKLSETTRSEAQTPSADTK